MGPKKKTAKKKTSTTATAAAKPARKKARPPKFAPAAAMNLGKAVAKARSKTIDRLPDIERYVQEYILVTEIDADASPRGAWQDIAHHALENAIKKVEESVCGTRIDVLEEPEKIQCLLRATFMLVEQLRKRHRQAQDDKLRKGYEDYDGCEDDDCDE